MKFTTVTFMVFLAAVFAFYWSLRKTRHRNILLIAASYVFYGWWDWRFCSLMLISSILDYSVGIMLGRTGGRRKRLLLLLLSICGNLGLLGFFKYFNFFAESFADFIGLFGMAAGPVTLHIVLPVGISFYTFQTMSYTIDVYRGTCPVCRDPIAVFAFVSFFPQLVAGPIERASNLLPQMINARRFDYAKAVDGCRQILWGFFKKIVLADNFGYVVVRVYGDIPGASGPELLFATLCFSFQIYCDFSAYSDIAIGTARLFGFDLMTNFSYPYFATNISNFWKRWHISLSTWFRDYVYIPLGGSRGGLPRTIRNVMITFLVSGFWHGASWNFIVWGGLHGLALTVYVLYNHVRREGSRRAGGVARAVKAGISALLTFVFVYLTWVFFRAETLPEACTVIRKMIFQAVDPSGFETVLHIIGRSPMVYVAFGIFYIVEFLQRGKPHPLVLPRLVRPVRWGLYLLLILLILGLGATPEISRDFIYFQF